MSEEHTPTHFPAGADVASHSPSSVSAEKSSLGDALPSTTQPKQAAPAQRPYVRTRPAHKSVDPIDDFSNAAEPLEHTVSDSSFTTRSGMLSAGSYRRSRSNISKMRQASPYGQYLEIPKGRREIFARKERRSNWLSFFALIMVLAVLAGALYLVYYVMKNTLGLPF